MGVFNPTPPGGVDTQVQFNNAGAFGGDADFTFAGDTLTATKIVAPTSLSTPSLISTGALTITPLAGSNLNVALSTTGDFAVNTNQLCVDTSTGKVGIGTTGPGYTLDVNKAITGDYVTRIINTDTAANRPSALLVRTTNQSTTGSDPILKVGTAANDWFQVSANGNVGIGTPDPAISALLELASTTGALLVPRMTTTQKNALTAVNGMIVYDTTLAKFQGYEAGAWAAFSVL